MKTLTTFVIVIAVSLKLSLSFVDSLMESNNTVFHERKAQIERAANQ